ncbi:MAG: sulfoxide reductase heme-binding subunit YedZ [Deltaproteobacteria bacterium]|nr:sulfoxide reductase heme-binding subunit YedZ [Deltaproteobacteria bacterium]
MKSLKQLAPRIAIAASTVPAWVLLARFLLGRLGADPVAEVLNQLGWAAIVCLLASLVCTPVRIVTDWAWPLALRKPLGLAAFFYALTHVSFYVAIDQGFDWAEILADVQKRRFIWAGLSAFVLLLPLALTSTQWATKKLGFKRWKRLHRLVYLVGALACLHYLWRFKLTEMGPVTAFFLLGLFLGTRVYAVLRGAKI